jgi:anaerobic selenocysteine-containing dehydrogenase
VAGLGRPFGRGSMTNHWNDIDNTSMVFAYGANPAENHPACMAHVNAARFGTDHGTKNAKLIVVDPRLTRTARQCDTARGDRYVRIRPGTNVAFSNGLMKWIFDNIGVYNATASDNMLAWHNGTAANSTAGRGFVDDLGAAVTVPSWPKYADTKFMVTNGTMDYARATRWVLGAKTAAEAAGVRSSVSLVGSTYHMWYKAAEGDSFLSHATSADGTTWAAGTLTDLPGGSANDNPFMWAEGTTYYMVNQSATGLEFRSITTSTPADLNVNANWSAPIDILRVAQVTDAGVSALDHPCVLKDGSNYRLFFKGEVGGTRRIFAGTTATAPASWLDASLGTSSFAKLGPTNWQVFAPAATGTSWDDLNVQHPHVKMVGTRYDMWYTGSGQVDTTLCVGYATSTDGITWTRKPSGSTGYVVGNTPVAGGSAAKPSVVINGTAAKLFVEEQTVRINYYVAQWISNFPVLAATVTTAGTVWENLKLHLAPYNTATVSDICGCTEADIAAVAMAVIDNSRFASSDFLAGMGAAGATPNASGYKATTILYAMGQTQHTNGSQNIKDLAVLQTLMGNMGRCGGGINALRGIHNVQGSTDMGLLFDSIPAYSANPAVDEHYSHYQNSLFGNRVEGNAAANAATKSSLIVRPAAANGRLTFTAKTAGLAGNGITIRYADPGPSNPTIGVGVVGSAVTVTLATDAGGLITSTAQNVMDAIGAFLPALSMPVTVALYGADTGAGLVNAAGPLALRGGYDAGAAVYDVSTRLGLQQRGFMNMTQEWFGNGSVDSSEIGALYDLWPKGNGVQHIKTFRNMVLPDLDANRIISAVVWGQNPAVTEPNQSKVRAGLKNLDMLVVVDMYETETAKCDRKSTGITYLIPACSHAEEAGSVTNSGRWLQWRERACAPKGNSKADLELLLRFAYALDNASAFSRILGVWAGLVTPIVPAVAGHAYAELFGKHGWTPDGVPGSFEALHTHGAEVWHARDAVVPGLTTDTVYGSEVVAENIFEEMARPLNYLADDTFSTTTGGTMWIYSGSGTGGGSPDATGMAGYNGSATFRNLLPAVTFNLNPVNWQTKNRAKSRNNVVTGNNGNGNLNNANNYPRWGWAWLLNRRVFYNNGEVAGDQADNFVSPGLVSCTYTINNLNTLADWALAYRKYKTFADQPNVVNATDAGYNTSSPHFVSAGLTFAGRFPGHTEPYESPRADLVTGWGNNMSNTIPTSPTGTYGGLLTAGDTRGTVGTYPLVLTTIRCVEHFQGGPTTRNNSWNVEAEPVPWIEINSVDARACVPPINDGDWVNVITIRSNSTGDEMDETPDRVDRTWARGFKARVGVGLQNNQRVAPGVVAIPWHWGDKGLSQGSRANDLCIDAWDANTMIPEYKACLCRIEKISVG